MTNKQAFIHAVEKAGIKMNYYLDTSDTKFFDESVMYIRAASSLLMEIDHENSEDQYGISY